MQQDAEVISLMDRASQRAGSDAALARMLDRRHQDISDMRHGRKTATPEDCALFAMVAGLDPITELARAAVRKHEGTKKGDLLLRALGKASLATGVAVASVGAHASLISGVVRTLVDTMYIM
jgi:hypothetical protein